MVKVSNSCEVAKQKRPRLSWRSGLTHKMALEVIFLFGPGFALFFSFLGQISGNMPRALAMGATIWLCAFLLAVLAGCLQAGENSDAHKATLVQRWVDSSRDDDELDYRRRIASSCSVDEVIEMASLTGEPVSLRSYF